MHKDHRLFETLYAGKKLVVETGKHALLANGACLVRYGDTVVICTATASESPRDGIDYFPLSVDYEERMYSVGRMPGGFKKRESRPSDSAVLTSRVIDRPMRPLFPDDLRNDVVIVCTVLSVEQDNQPEIAAMLGASISIAISDIPFNGPVGAVAVGLVDGEIVINPDAAQRRVSEMYMTISGTSEKVCMIELGAKEVSDDIVYEAIIKGQEEIKKICAFINEMTAAVGKEKFQYQSVGVPEEVSNEIKVFAYDEMKAGVMSPDKRVREENLRILTEKVKAEFGEKYADTPSYISDSIYKLEKKVVRDLLLKEKKRVDGRGLEEIRELYSEVGILPRTHGSGLFQRGQTQVLTNVTLSSISDAQRIDGLDDSETENRYMHHYNFPAYSVGEAKTSRGPGRREIGHGELAEKALEAVIPSKDEFPYAIRVVSDVLMSNGSTSQGSICGSTLALMDAGVPIKAPVAGISCGLVTDEKDADNYVIMMDIQGIEDFFGDMDFKVAGTHKGITAIQVDIKLDGLKPQVIKEALEMTRKGRRQILDDSMLKAIDKPRTELSEYAPKIITLTIDVDKIKDVIGSGGKVINKIIEQTGVKIDIEEDGTVYVATIDMAAGRKAVNIIEALTKEIKVGMIFEKCPVVRLMNFGVFVEYLPGKDGLVHISQLEHRRVETVEEVVQVGDIMDVKVIEIDRQGRINLSRKALLDKPDRAHGEENHE
ncbi:MAG: polyribonucleotide nucleotidyltransferase [Clostridia bacterium]